MLKSTYVPSAAAAATSAPLPRGWTQHTAPTGHSYYYNAETKESTYQRPGLAPTPPEPAQAQTYSPYVGMPSLADPNVANAYMAQLNRGTQQQRRQDHAKGPARPRPQPIDKPRRKIPIPGHDSWLLVYTKYSRRFVYNSAKNASYWRIPEKLMPAILEMDKQRIQDKAAATDANRDMETADADADAELGSEYEEIEVTDDEGDGQDADSDARQPNKRPRTDAEKADDEEVGEKEREQDEGPLEFTEDDIAMQLQMMGDDYGLMPGDDDAYNEDEITQDGPPGTEGPAELSEEDAEQLFADLLDDLGVSPYSPWEKLLEDGKMVDDPRYTALRTTKARRACHDRWSRARIAERRRAAEQAAQSEERRDPRVAFLALLAEKATPKLYWPEFRRKHRKEAPMRDVALADRDREKMYREHVRRLGRPAAELRADLVALLEAQPAASLNRLSLEEGAGGGVRLPVAVRADLRYISLAPAVRDPLIEAFLQNLPPPPPPQLSVGSADGRGGEEGETGPRAATRERRERALREHERAADERRRRLDRLVAVSKARLRDGERELDRAMRVTKKGLQGQLVGGVDGGAGGKGEGEERR